MLPEEIWSPLLLRAISSPSRTHPIEHDRTHFGEVPKAMADENGLFPGESLSRVLRDIPRILGLLLEGHLRRGHAGRRGTVLAIRPASASLIPVHHGEVRLPGDELLQER
jgi:hypothetical protein